MLIQNEDQFTKAINVLQDADYVVVDTETFPIKPDEPTYLMGIATYSNIAGRDMEMSFYFPFRHQHNPSLLGPEENLPLEWMDKFHQALLREDVTLIFHNAKFDLAVLKRDGIDLTDVKFYDTMLMHHLSNENPPHGLKPLSRRLLNEPGLEEKQIKKLAETLGTSGEPRQPKSDKFEQGWPQIPPSVMAKYAEKDVELTWKLYQFLERDLVDQELMDLTTRESDFCLFLLQMEENGVLIDSQVAKRLDSESSVRQGEIQSLLGFDPMKSDQLARKLFGAKPEGFGLPIRGRGASSKSYPKGRPVMDKAALASYGADYPETQSVIDLVLEYRGLVKARSTWFGGFLEKIWPDGRVHPSYRQHGTVTSRLSCSDPNMQQLPRTTKTPLDLEEGLIEAREKVKWMLAVPDGYELWGYDYSQIEFRLAAVYSQEEEILEAYREGSDMHQLTADALGVDRYMGKTINFAQLYGAGPSKLAEMLGIGLDAARLLYRAFWERYPKLEQTAKKAEAAAQRQGFVRLWTGRRRHFKYPSEYHKAFNSVIQGGAAEIIKESCLKFQHEYPELKINGLVHDELWFEIPTDAPMDYHGAIKKVMEWPLEDFGLPFPVEGKRLA